MGFCKQAVLHTMTGRAELTGLHSSLQAEQLFTAFMLCSVIGCPLKSCYSALDDKMLMTQPLVEHFHFAFESWCL